MNYTELQTFFNRHCRIKLRSGKEVFGVLWEDLSDTDRAIYFASYIEHKRKANKPGKEIYENNPLLHQLNPDDILGIEHLAES